MTDNNPNPDVKTALQNLREDYIAHTQERIKEIEAFVEYYQKNELSEKACQELLSLAHRYVGTGATYGFPFVSEAARKLEEYMEGNKKIDFSELMKHVSEFLSACSRMQHEQAAEMPVPQTQKDSKPAGPVHKIGIIDDDPAVQAILTTILEAEAKIFVGNNADDARRIMTEEKPDLVILDDMMKDSISGLKFMEEIRNDPIMSAIPVIMLTASDKTEEVMRGLMAGAVDYIAKPFDPAEVAEKIKARLNRQQTCVMIVEDDKNVRLLLEFKFRGVGCKVVTCENGREALDMVGKVVPDVIILDRMMPGMDGLVVLRNLRLNNRFQNTPVIFLTAKKQESEVIEGLRVGADDYIIKPFNPDEVVMRAAQVLRNRKKK